MNYIKNIFYLLLLVPLFSCGQQNGKILVKKGVDTTQYVPMGLKIGDDAPLIMETSLKGNKINTGEIIKEKNVVLIFYRGNWCPYCNKFLNNLNDSLQYISNNNAEVIVVGPESYENSEITADKAEASFILIPDSSMKIQKDYDVIFKVTKKYQGKIKTFLRTDIAENNNQKEAQLPVPATYIIGKDGKIIWRHFDYDYTKRSSVREIINALK